MICAKILVPLMIPFMAMAMPAKKAHFQNRSKQVMDMSEPQEVVGIGVTVLDDKGVFTVKNVLPNTPAEQVRTIKGGDRILQVRASEMSNWTLVDGLTLKQVVYLIRGPVNSVMGLRLRDENGNDKEVNLVRKSILY